MDPNMLKLSSTYPPAPMLYINHYTNDNVKNGMIPPPPPIIRDNYLCFGKPIDPNDVLIRTLESQGIQRVYKTNDHKKELKKLNHSILMNYLDLLDILVKSPNKLGPSGRTLREEKLEEIELLFINMHHLINELRPHQARDNLKSILEIQKQQREEMKIKFEKHLYKIIDLLKLSIQSIKLDENDYFEFNKYLNDLNQLVNKSKEIDNNNNNNDIEIKQTSSLSSSTTGNNKKLNENQNENFKDKILCDIVDEFLLNNFQNSQ